MAIIKAATGGHCSLSGIIKYVSREEKTEEMLLSGFNCSPETAEQEMMSTKFLYNKPGGRLYKHFVQSFSPEEQITPEQAHALACQYVAECPQFHNFEVLIATHKDKTHIHTHFIVNSVSLDGHKFRMHRDELQQMKDVSDRLCLEHGLSVCEKGKTFSGKVREETVAYSKEVYQLLKKAERGEAKSYVQDLAIKILDCRSRSTSQEEFTQRMRTVGVGVDWQQSHKYITFTDLKRQSDGEKQCKIRNNKLEKNYGGLGWEKEDFQRVFESNLREQQSRQRAALQLEEAHRSAERNNFEFAETDARAFCGKLDAAERVGAEKLQSATNARKTRQTKRIRPSIATQSRIGGAVTDGIGAALQTITNQLIDEAQNAQGEHRERI